MSTSLWGRELKDSGRRFRSVRHCVDLLVRSWIERIISTAHLWWKMRSTSLWGRELKVTARSAEIIFWNCRPPCEVVNWKVVTDTYQLSRCCRPPCEVVNWKILDSRCFRNNFVDLLVRSWIERLFPIWKNRTEKVDLLVRSWIERLTHIHKDHSGRVDLLVRSWIERIVLFIATFTAAMSTSLWGRELKGSAW